MPRPDRAGSDPREQLELRILNLDQELNRILYDGVGQNLYRAAANYVGQAETLLRTGDIGGSFVCLQNAKSLLGIVEDSEE